MPGFFDIGDSRQSITPADAPDFLIDGSLEIDDLLEVVGAENTGINLGGDLVQVVADSLQLRHQGSGIFRYIDLGLLCGSDQKIRDAHAGAENLFHDGFVFLLCQPDGKCLVSFSQIIILSYKMVGMEWVWASAQYSFVLGGQPSALLAPSRNDGKMTGILNSSQYSLKRKRYATRLFTPEAAVLSSFAGSSASFFQIRGGQAEADPALVDFKPQTAILSFFRQMTQFGVGLRIRQQPLFEVRVVGVHLSGAVLFIEEEFCDLLLSLQKNHLRSVDLLRLKSRETEPVF